MELRDSKETISYFSRIALQLPTIVLSTATMIVISRHLGPSGRGEVSQILLLAAITTSMITTPIFLNIMHLKHASEIESYVSSSIFLFKRRNMILVGALNAGLFLLDIASKQVLTLENMIYMNLLITFYFIATQIRDLLIRFQKNEIYVIDLATQMVITGSILGILIFHNLAASSIIKIFAITYGSLASLLLVILKARVKDFKYVHLVRIGIDTAGKGAPPKTKNLFSKLGVLFQFSMSKDLLLGVLILSKTDFGLMSALTSFWVVIRFLRPSAVIQAKLGINEKVVTTDLLRDILAFLFRANSAIYVQIITIAAVGLLSFIMSPILLGKGFSPNIGTVIAGTASEILLMKCLYDLSTETSRYSQNLFLYLMMLQIVILMSIELSGIKTTIDLIWISSALSYLGWQVINHVRRRK